MLQNIISYVKSRRYERTLPLQREYSHSAISNEFGGSGWELPRLTGGTGWDLEPLNLLRGSLNPITVRRSRSPRTL